MKRTPLKPGRQRTKVCARTGCNAEFTDYPSHLSQRRYCSLRCAYDDRKPQSLELRAKKSATMRRRPRAGTANPNYRHGRKAGKQIRGWSVKAKGETCCRICGATSNLHLHHAIPRGIGTKESRRDLRNGVTLCGTCHGRWHRGVRCVPRAAFTAEEWAYIASVTLTGRETAYWLDEHYPPAA